MIDGGPLARFIQMSNSARYMALKFCDAGLEYMTAAAACRSVMRYSWRILNGLGRFDMLCSKAGCTLSRF
jgi:hypothetical protein